MKQFKESDHPRDSDGKFTNKNTSSSSVTIKEELKEYSKKISEYKNKTKIQEDTKDFKRQLDLMSQNKLKFWNAIQVRKETPKVLQDLGFKNLPMLITQSHVKKIVGNDKGNHDIPVDTLIKIPEFLEKPEYVLKSKTDADSVVVVTSLIDKIDNPIVVAIKKDGDGRYNNIEVKSNFITSIYGKDKFDRFVDSSEILYKK